MTDSRGRPARSTWLERPLGSLARFINGEPFKPSDWSDEGLPIVRIENLNDPAAPFHYYRDAPGDKVLIEQGELLLAWSASLGVHWWRRGPALLNQHIFKVVPIENMVSREYLYYALSWALRGLISLTHGGTMHHIQKPALESYQVPCPPLIQQQRIVAKLDEQIAALDRAEQVLAEQQAAASTLSTAVLQQVFSSPDSKRWPLVALTEVLSLQYGKSLPESTRNPGEYPVMGSNGIVGYHDEWFVSGPTIVVGRKGSSGKVTWEDRNCFPIDTTYFVVPKAKNPRLRFLYFFLKWSNLGHLSEASGVPGLNRDRVYKLLCPIPPLPEQSQIVNRLEETSNLATILLEHLDNQRSAVAAVRSALLDAAFSGEI